MLNVEVRDSEIAGAGRGLFALNDLSPGDLVVAIDRPAVAEVNVNRRGDTCAWCFQRGEIDPMGRARAASMGLPHGFIEVKSCTGCRRVGYCSKTCQSKAWKAEHKYECKVLAPKERPDLPEGVRATVKLLGRLAADPAGKQSKLLDLLQFRPSTGPNSLEDFSRSDKERFEDYQMLSFRAWTYASKLKLADDLDSQNIAKALLFNFMCNTIELNSPLDSDQLGIGFDPLVCSANHSCDPNVVSIFNQPAMVLRALKPIKKGDEIFMKYTEVTNPFGTRQANLKEDYFFTCQCSKCKQGPVLPQDVFAKKPEQLAADFCKLADGLIKRHEKHLSKYLSPREGPATWRLGAMEAEAFTIADDETSDIEQIKGAIKMCIESRMWTWTRQPVPQLCRQLFGAYMSSGSTYKAFRVGLKLHLQISPELNPQPFYPDRLIDAWALSTVSNVLCGPMFQDIYKDLKDGGVDLRLAFFKLLFEAHDQIPRMYGIESPFGKVVNGIYGKVLAGMNISESEIRDQVKAGWPAFETLARSVQVSSL